jgi:acetyl esterase/lipase
VLQPETLRIDRVDGPPLVADLWRSIPQGPAVVYLHGGAWVAGKRTDHATRLARLAAAGITVLSIDYRLATTAPFPAQREDAETAATWLLDVGSVAKPGDIAIMGASAGAHLAALTIQSSTFPFAGFVGLFGRYDLRASADELRPAAGLVIPTEILENPLPEGYETPDLRLAALAGVVTTPTEGTRELLSPISQLTPGDAPMLLLHGTADALVHHGHSLAFAEAATRSGVDCEIVLLPGANHEDPAFDEPQSLMSIAAFIRDATSRTPNRRK